MTELQLQFARHWVETGKAHDRRSLGELLGVYWTSKGYHGSKSSGDGPSKKSDEVFLPLAAILNPDVLNKTLDRVLAGGKSQSMPGEFDLGQLPYDEFQRLFRQASSAPAESVPTPEPAVLQSVPAMQSDLPPGLDLEALRQVDPELAAHLDPNAGF
jgi:hypothetical protein